MTWLIVIGVVAAVCGLIGYFSGGDGNRGEKAFEGAAAGAVGCGSVIFYLAMTALSFYLLFAIIGWLFD
jgi:hypothetical protein